MTQDQWTVLLLKVFLISGALSILGWVGTYSWLTKWKSWRNPLGLSLMIFALLIAGLLSLFILSIFFQLTRFDSRLVAWAAVTVIGAITPAMLQRTIVFIKISRRDRGR